MPDFIIYQLNLKWLLKIGFVSTKYRRQHSGSYFYSGFCIRYYASESGKTLDAFRGSSAFFIYRFFIIGLNWSNSFPMYLYK